MPLYSVEMILVGIILLSGMSITGINIWIKRKNEPEKKSLTNPDKNLEPNKDL